MTTNKNDPCAPGGAGNYPSTVTAPPAVAIRRTQFLLHPELRHRACRDAFGLGLFEIGFGVDYSTGKNKIETGT